jgi:hypothetical protein
MVSGIISLIHMKCFSGLNQRIDAVNKQYYH